MIHKREKLDFLQIKNFCSAENLVKRMKRQGTIWKKIFASYISDKSFIPKIYKELLQFKNKKKNTNMWRLNNMMLKKPMS